MRKRTTLVMLVVLTTVASTAIDAASGEAPAGPVSTGPPTIKGHVNFNDTVSCDVGKWNGSPTSFTVGWFVFGATQSGSGPTFKISNPSYMGYSLTCQVTAKDAAGATGTAQSAPVKIQTGRTSMKIDSIKIRSKGRFTVKGRILPRLVSSKYGDGAAVVIQRSLGHKTVTQLSSIATVDKKGRFTVDGVDSPGRKTIKVVYNPGHGGYGVWSSVEVDRRIKVTKGGRPVGGGGTVGIG